jgi:hypothetical protein
MEILLFRTALAPCLVLLVSLVARRVGPRLGGRLLGAPTTSGPFLAVLCLGSGTGAAENAAHGSAAGQLSVACFCFSYGRLAAHLRPAVTLALSLGAVAAAGVVEMLSSGAVAITAVLALALVLLNLPSLHRPPHPDSHQDSHPLPHPTTSPSPTPADDRPQPNPLRWQAIALRMALSATLVLGCIGLAGVAGPFAGGLLSALPVLLAVMAPALHRSSGPAAAADLVRGALTSCGGTLAFLLVLCVALVPLGAPTAFGPALAALAAADLLVRRVGPQPLRTIGRLGSRFGRRATTGERTATGNRVTTANRAATSERATTGNRATIGRRTTNGNRATISDRATPTNRAATCERAA